MIEAKTNIPTMAFKHASETARMAFLNVQANDDSCIIHLGSDDLANQVCLESVCSLCGNTPGLADALIASINKNSSEKSDKYEIHLVIQRDDEAEMPFNHPRKNSERVRVALS